MKNNTPGNAGKIIKRVILLFVIALIGLAGFYFLNPKKAITLFFPDLDKINNIKANIRNDSAFTKISMVLQNKNPYKLDIKKLDFEAFLNDTSIAKQNMVLNIKQASQQIDTVNLPLNLSIKLIKGLIAHLQNQDSTGVELKGAIVYETIFGETKINFHRKTKIEVPVPPQIKVIKVEREGFNFKEKILTAMATIKIINRGKKLDLKLSDINYEMTVKNTLHTQGVITKPIIIKPQASEIVTIPIRIKVYHPLKIMWMLNIEKERLNYTLHVTCKMKENISQNSFSSPVEITATGQLPPKGKYASK